MPTIILPCAQTNDDDEGAPLVWHVIMTPFVFLFLEGVQGCFLVGLGSGVFDPFGNLGCPWGRELKDSGKERQESREPKSKTCGRMFRKVTVALWSVQQPYGRPTNPVVGCDVVPRRQVLDGCHYSKLEAGGQSGELTVRVWEVLRLQSSWHVVNLTTSGTSSYLVADLTTRRG